MNGTIEQLRSRASGSNPLVSWTDEKLLLSYRFDHNTGAFEELVHRYERELYGYLRHYLGNAEMAEDVFQQTFLQVHLRCDQFEPGRKVRPWLYTVAVNQAIDCQRRTRRHRLASLDRIAGTNDDGEAGALIGLLRGAGTGPAAEAESAEQSETLHQAVDALPAICREVVTLVYFQGLKYREAAEILGVPVGTVKSRLHTAVEKLTAALTAAGVSPLQEQAPQAVLPHD